MSNKFRGSDRRSEVTLFVGGVPTSLTEDDLWLILSQYGDIHNLILIQSKRRNRSRGFGFFNTSSSTAKKLVAAEILAGDKVLDIMISQGRPQNSNAMQSLNRIYFSTDRLGDIDRVDAKIAFSKLGELRKIEIKNGSYEGEEVISFPYGVIEFLNPAIAYKLNQIQILTKLSPKGHIYLCYSSKRSLIHANSRFITLNPSFISKNGAKIEEHCSNLTRERLTKKNHPRADICISNKNYYPQFSEQLNREFGVASSRALQRLDEINIMGESTMNNIRFFSLRNSSVAGLDDRYQFRREDKKENQGLGSRQLQPAKCGISQPFDCID